MAKKSHSENFRNFLLAGDFDYNHLFLIHQRKHFVREVFVSTPRIRSYIRVYKTHNGIAGIYMLIYD